MLFISALFWFALCVLSVWLASQRGRRVVGGAICSQTAALVLGGCVVVQPTDLASKAEPQRMLMRSPPAVVYQRMTEGLRRCETGLAAVDADYFVASATGRVSLTLRLGWNRLAVLTARVEPSSSAEESAVTVWARPADQNLVNYALTAAAGEALGRCELRPAEVTPSKQQHP